MMEENQERMRLVGVDMTTQEIHASSDYHRSMDLRIMVEYTKKHLLPNIPNNAVIAMNQAGYHSSLDPFSNVPASTAPIEVFQQWLTHHNVTFIPRPEKVTNNAYSAMLMREIKKKAKTLTSTPKYVLEKVIEEYKQESGMVNMDIKLIFTPAYHCCFNPIKQVWRYGKYHIQKSKLLGRTLHMNINIFTSAILEFARTRPIFFKYANKSMRTQVEMYEDDIRMNRYKRQGDGDDQDDEDDN